MKLKALNLKTNHKGIRIQTNKQTNRQTNKQTDKQIDRQQTKTILAKRRKENNDNNDRQTEHTERIRNGQRNQEWKAEGRRKIKA